MPKFFKVLEQSGPRLVGEIVSEAESIADYWLRRTTLAEVPEDTAGVPKDVPVDNVPPVAAKPSKPVAAKPSNVPTK